jgi:hypothetical protein
VTPGYAFRLNVKDTEPFSKKKKSGLSSPWLKITSSAAYSTSYDFSKIFWTTYIGNLEKKEKWVRIL